MSQPYPDRRTAGRRLADALVAYAGDPSLLVLGLPRGGVPVAYEVARALRAPLDVYVVRKLGAPGHEELAMGAIASGGVRVLNREVVGALDLKPADLDAVAEREAAELARRERAYRGPLAPPDPVGRTAVVVDDGLATGSTMRAAVAALRRQGAGRVVVAVPVGAPESCALLEPEVDELVCPLRPPRFHAVGLWYDDFAQTTDDEVRELLERARQAATRVD